MRPLGCGCFGLVFGFGCAVFAVVIMVRVAVLLGSSGCEVAFVVMVARDAAQIGGCCVALGGSWCLLPVVAF